MPVPILQYGKDLQIDSQSNEFEARVVHNLVATFLKVTDALLVHITS